MWRRPARNAHNSGRSAEVPGVQRCRRATHVRHSLRPVPGTSRCMAVLSAAAGNWARVLRVTAGVPASMLQRPWARRAQAAWLFKVCVVTRAAHVRRRARPVLAPAAGNAFLRGRELSPGLPRDKRKY